MSCLQVQNLRTQTIKISTRFDLLTSLHHDFPGEAIDPLLANARARATGCPLQHLTGVQVFLDHEYEVSPDVLIPRPETEILLSEARSLLQQGETPRLGVEVGLGSGILSIELLAHFEQLQMLATEYSEKARGVAAKNAAKILGITTSRLQVLIPASPLEVLEPVLRHLAGKKADFIISNPPYLDQAEGGSETEQSVVEYEPHEALFPSTGDPNYFYKILAVQGPRLLKSQGLLFLEIPHERSQAIADLFGTKGCWEIKILLDLTGRERVLIARLVHEQG